MKPQFIAMPYFGELVINNLTYVDVLTYAIIRSSADISKNLGLSFEEIGKISNLSFVEAVCSIMRLNKADFIEINEIGSINSKVNYNFCGRNIDSEVPYKILHLNLSNLEKVIMFYMKMNDLTGVTELGELVGTIHSYVGLSFEEVYETVDGLITKGFIDCVDMTEDEESILVKPTESINWQGSVENPNIFLI